MASLVSGEEFIYLKKYMPLAYCGTFYELVKIYDAGTDGLNIEKVYKACANQGPTLHVAFSSRYIAGGYRSHAVIRGQGVKRDHSAFLFRLKEKGKSSQLVVKANRESSVQICDKDSQSPAFGPSLVFFGKSGNLNEPCNGGCKGNGTPTSGFQAGCKDEEFFGVANGWSLSAFQVFSVVVHMNPPRFVVSIDFGTTFSGFAYASYETLKLESTTENPAQKVNAPTAYPEANRVEYVYSKTATALWYFEDPSVPPLWGWPAVLKAMETKNAKDWQYQTLFKLRLLPNNGKKDLPPLPPGKSSGIELIVDYLIGMRELILKSLTGAGLQNIKVHEIKWCLTVPAQWDQAARMSMHKVAKLAGLVQNDIGIDNEGSSHSLEIVLEPEAASIMSLFTAEDRGVVERLFVSKNVRMNSDPIPRNKGEPFLIVDCGGGTVDLVVQKLVRVNGRIRTTQVSPASGGLCGGSRVDDAFWQIVSANFKPAAKPKEDDPNTFEEWKELKPDMLVKQASKWEMLKRTFDGLNEEAEPSLPSKPDFGIVITKFLPKPFTINLKSIVDPVLEEIFALIDEQLEKNKEIQVILVVGGFSKCPYLKRKLHERYLAPETLPALYPEIYPARNGKLAAGKYRLQSVTTVPDASTTIMNGAVLLSLDPDLITHRCMKKTFGVQHAPPALPGTPASDTTTLRGRVYFKHGFCPLVKRGDIVSTHEVVSKKFKPNRAGESIEVALYATNKTKVSDIRHLPKSAIVATMLISSQGNPNFGSGGVTVFLNFAGTVVEMWAVDDKSGSKMQPVQLDMVSIVEDDED